MKFEYLVWKEVVVLLFVGLMVYWVLFMWVGLWMGEWVLVMGIGGGVVFFVV